MTKYKQKVIPKATDSQFKGMKLGELKTYVSDVFSQTIANTKVTNLHKGISIVLSKSGLRHLLYARSSGYTKLKAVVILPEMLTYATYCNFNEPDTNDGVGVLGYLNFKCNAIIEGKQQIFRLVVRLTKDGKFYYDHSVKLRVQNKKP